MFSKLDRYQKEAYWASMKIARQHGGSFLCDGVGLGKTFVGLMLIERLILHEGKRVVLFAPKAAKEAVWEPHLRAVRFLAATRGIARKSQPAIPSRAQDSRPCGPSSRSALLSTAEANPFGSRGPARTGIATARRLRTLPRDAAV